MILFQNWELFASLIFYFGTKILCYTFEMIRQSTLTSIPERNEDEEPSQKWVPKKKHEVLKAKYKCLKKLFQIYDASLIGMTEPNIEYADDTRTNRRRKRSHRTKTDACAGTTEITSGDIHFVDEYDKQSTATEVTNLKTNQSCSTQFENCKSEILKETNSNYAETNDSNLSLVVKERENPHPVPYLILNERRKLTRFQCFVQRIFGIRRESYIMSNNVYAASDSLREKQRRRGLRFRRLRRTKKIKSESDLKTIGSPAILSYVQSIQRSCLMDTTPRQCPVLGCRMVSYGIINYNDHLNICHFKDRKYICHYCHEGFERECEKYAHENEHIGLNKLSANLSSSSTRNKVASNCITQTEPEVERTIPEEKLKKIVSFFDRITNEDELVEKIKKRNSETNLTETEVESTSGSNNSSEKRTVSCINIGKGKCESSNSSDVTSQSLSCRLCGENFDYREQLSRHVDLQHRVNGKFCKIHSCPGMAQSRYRGTFTPLQDQMREGYKPQSVYDGEAFKPRRDGYGECIYKARSVRRDLVSEDGRLNVLSIDSSEDQSLYSCVSTTTPSEVTVTRDKSEESLTCDPSTNIVYSSMDSIKKPSVVGALAKKVRSYKWEPETKIIRV